MTLPRLWRVRSRLLLSYFLFGVVPLVLVAGMVWAAATTLFGMIAGDRVRRGIDERTKAVAAAAREVATAAASQRGVDPAALASLFADVQTAGDPVNALVAAGGDVRAIPAGGAIHAIPAWSRPGIAGILEAEGRFFIAAHVRRGTPPVDVFAYEPLGPDTLAALTREVSRLALVPLDDGTDIDVNLSPRGSRVTLDRHGIRTPITYVEGHGLPEKRGPWDPVLGWAVRQPLRTASGDARQVLFTFVSRPSMLMPVLAGQYDVGIPVLVAVAVILGAALLVLILTSVAWSIQITRTITRAVHELHAGTRQVAAGNLTHRTPVRGRDQLSELASSFNGMTDRIQQLIVEVGEKKKLESELEIARHVQLQQFPKSVPTLESLEMAARCVPGRFVSGDYYDFIPLADGQLALALGDVAGKGISAALVMASLQSALHAQVAHVPAHGAASNGQLSPAALVARLSEQLYENTPPEKYATFFYSTYDGETGRLLYTNAGHLPPMLVRAGRTIRLQAGGTVIGLLPLYAYEEEAVALQPGDLLAVFSDGVTEAEDGAGEQFGEDRLASLLIEHVHKPLEEIIGIVTDRVFAWAHDPAGQDDTTILLARRI